MSWLKFLRLPALAAVFVCWPLVPMNTDDSWVADGTVAATWLAIINWLLPAAAIAGLYIMVRKKMEILLVSPFNPLKILIAKAVPYLILSLINFTVILLLSVYMLDVPIRGNLLLLYAESTLFIIICLSLGLLISTITASQQTAMLIAMMGMMLPTAFIFILFIHLFS